MEGTINYFSGGTTGDPKVIMYDRSKWVKSVSNTFEILNLHGVNSNSKVIVAFPFSPWAIGDIFTESLLKCGADVYPIGLNITQRSFMQFLHDDEITHICTPPRILLSIQKEINKSKASDLEKIFVAGEELQEKHRVKLASYWSCEIINVYGKAEFDTIGFENMGNNYFTLLPYFEYKIKTMDNYIRPLSIGLIGELLIRDSNESNWINTGDKIKVVTEENYLKNRTWGVSIRHRIDDTITLSCGANINSTQVHEIKKNFRVFDYIQIIVNDHLERDRIDINIVADMVEPDTCDKVKDCFIHSSIDIFDSYFHGAIQSINVNVINENKLIKTRRGKIKNLIKLSEEEQEYGTFGGNGHSYKISK